MVHGIERRNIVDDDKDRDRFISRAGEIALDTGNSEAAGTRCRI